MAVSAPMLIGSFASTGNVTTSGTIALSAGASVGDLVFVDIGAGAVSPTTGVSDTKSNTWTRLTSVTTSVAASTQETWYTKVTTALTTSDTITVTRSPTGGMSVVVQKYAGVASSSYLGTPITAGTIRIT